MSSRISKEAAEIGLYSLGIALFIVLYLGFFRQVFEVWMRDIEFSYGILVPPLSAYLLWFRRKQLQDAGIDDNWIEGLMLVVLSSILAILASVSSNLMLWSVAFALTAIGVVGFIWGRTRQRIVTAPLLFLVLMAPVPSFVLSQLSWKLKEYASSISSIILRLAGIPVFQNGNLLRLPNYVLEVKEACSGTRSIFALLALAIVLGLTSNQPWWKRTLLVAMAAPLAVVGNVIRIVGTGLIAFRDGQLAANESLHSAWGIVVFMIAVFLLLGFQRAIGWQTSESAH